MTLFSIALGRANGDIKYSHIKNDWELRVQTNWIRRGRSEAEGFWIITQSLGHIIQSFKWFQINAKSPRGILAISVTLKCYRLNYLGQCALRVLIFSLHLSIARGNMTFLADNPHGNFSSGLLSFMFGVHFSVSVVLQLVKHRRRLKMNVSKIDDCSLENYGIGRFLGKFWWQAWLLRSISQKLKAISDLRDKFNFSK